MPKIDADQLPAHLRDALAEALNGGTGDVTVTIQNIAIDLITASGENDRIDFKKVPELATSIYAAGRLLQAITVRQVSDDLYKVIAGETRWRAFQLLHSQHPDDPRWSAIPAVVTEADDETASMLMLVENSARKNLNPLEEARAFQVRISRFGWSVEQVADVAGVKVELVEKRLLLLGLSADIQEMIAKDQFPPVYGVVIAKAELSPNYQALALQAYVGNKAPTLDWYRSVVGQLQAQQGQASMFDLSTLTMQAQETIKAPEVPPPPKADTGPLPAGQDVIRYLAKKHNECRRKIAAARAAGKARRVAEWQAYADGLETAIEALRRVTA